uniref:Uncharacterized protein n=1 Tax=Cucumis melo TaxID=3656 RepID=A0A9I9EJR1_CUCME
CCCEIEEVVRKILTTNVNFEEEIKSVLFFLLSCAEVTFNSLPHSHSTLLVALSFLNHGSLPSLTAEDGGAFLPKLII